MYLRRDFMLTKKLAAAIFTLGLSSTAFGASTATSTADASLYQKLKDSPASLRLYTNFETSRDKKAKINGTTNTSMLYVGWKFSDTDKIRLENRLVTKRSFTGEDRETKYDVSRQVIKYTRSGILSQDKNGIDLSANAELRYHPNSTTRDAKNRYGHGRLSVGVGKDFGKFNLGSSLFYARNILKKEGVLGTARDYWLLVTAQTYSFTDKLSLSFSQEWYHGNTIGTKAFQANKKGIDKLRDANEVYAHLETNYVFNKVLTGGLAVGATPLASNDGRTFVKHLEEKLIYNVNLNISAF